MRPTRRDFLRNSALLALSPTVPGFLARTARAAATEPDARGLVVLQLTGGNDGLNTVVPFADDGYARYRPKLRLPTDQLFKIDDSTGLHPSLEDFHRLLETGRLAVVQGVGYPNPSRSHFRSMACWHTCRFDAKDTGHGWLGLALDGAASPADQAPASVFVGEQTPPALRGRRSKSSVLGRLDDLMLTGDVDPRRAVAERETEADVRAYVRRTFLDAYTTADRLKGVEAVRDAGARYPAGPLAERLRLVAQLLKAGLGTRVYYLEQDGYDTHAAQLPQHARLLTELGGALRAFLDDLKAAGLAERVAVLAFSEFGRRVAENGSFGTDHGTAGPVFVAGGGVRAGLVGKAPRLTDLDKGDLQMGIDFRRVYATLLKDWLNVSAAEALGGDFGRLPLF